MDEDGSPQPDDSQSAATMRRILAAATEEFAAEGFAGARINRIATNAAANKQLIYRYFGGKQELYEAVLVEMTRASRSLLAQERSSGLDYLDFLATHESGLSRESQFPLWAKILGWEGMTNAQQGPEVEELRRVNFRTRSEWIETDQGAGELDPGYPPALLHALLMAVSTFPITMPRTFKLILDKDEITDDDLRDWFVFVRQLVGDTPDQ